VRIYLKRSSRGTAACAVEAASAADPASGHERILVVEDDDALREYSVDILKELGYDVVQAAHAAEALQRLDSGVFDLLFTDVVMPGGMNGRQLADEAQRRQPGLKVLFTTGYSRDALAPDNRLDPGTQLISKPFAYDELAAKVRAVLES
jgi:CheY-like chemotaxis protein